jgi:hypothetical protein
MNINDCHKIQRYGYTSYWYIKPNCPERVFLKEKIDREDFHVVGEIDGYYEYRITNDFINAVGASGEYLMTANGALGFNSIWDYDNSKKLYWCVDLCESPYIVINKVELKPEPWWDAQGYYQRQWIAAFCREWDLEPWWDAQGYYQGQWIAAFCREWDLEDDEEEDDIKLGEDIVEMEIVKTEEMRGGDSLFWNWEIGKKPRLFSLTQLTYPSEIDWEFSTIREGRGQEQKIYRAYEYAVTPEVLSVYARVNKKVNTPKGEVTFYVVEDNGSSKLEDTNFFYWAVDPDGNVLGTYSRWIGDNEDLNWRGKITKQFCAEPAFTV